LDNLVHTYDPKSNADQAALAFSAWREGKMSELSTVNLTISSGILASRNVSSFVQAALIAAVVSAPFSWPTFSEPPWTARAVFFASLITVLSTVASASQQSIALYRLGQHCESLKLLHKLLQSCARDGSASRLQKYMWQMPVMLLNISVASLIVGLLILIWDRAAKTPAWDDDVKVSDTKSFTCVGTYHEVKIAFVASLAGHFAFANYAVGAMAINTEKQTDASTQTPKAQPMSTAKSPSVQSAAVSANNAVQGNKWVLLWTRRRSTLGILLL
jgi:hypothetical protein